MLAAASRECLLPSHALAMGAGLFLIVVVLPWLTGVYFRANHQDPPRLSRRLGGALLAGLLAPLGGAGASLIVGMAIASAMPESIQPWAFLVIPTVIGVGVCLTSQWWLLQEWRRLHWRQEMSLACVWVLAIVLGGAGGMGLLNRVLNLATGMGDLINLHGIASAMHVYHDGYGEFPDDLHRLVDGGYDPAPFISPFSGTRKIVPVKRPYEGPLDYQYIRLPDDAPKDLIWMWVPPSIYEGEGGWVLRFSGEGEWMTPDEMVKEVGRTHAWLLSHQPVGKTTSAARGGIDN